MDKIAALHYECVMESFYDIDVSPANEANIGSIVKTIGEKVLAAIKFVIGRFKKLLQWIKSKAFRRKKVEKPAEKKQGEDRKENRRGRKGFCGIRGQYRRYLYSGGCRFNTLLASCVKYVCRMYKTGRPS